MLGKKSNDALATSCLVAGIFLGIFFSTGTSVDPTDVMGLVAQSLADQISPILSALVAVALIIVSIIGVWQTVQLVASGSKEGIMGLVMTISCFSGGILIFFSPLIAVILILVGFGIANYSQ